MRRQNLSDQNSSSDFLTPYPLLWRIRIETFHLWVGGPPPAGVRGAPSIANFGQGSKMEYTGESLRELPRFPSENVSFSQVGSGCSSGLTLSPTRGSISGRPSGSHNWYTAPPFFLNPDSYIAGDFIISPWSLLC